MSDPTVINRTCVTCLKPKPHTEFSRTFGFKNGRRLADSCLDCGGKVANNQRTPLTSAEALSKTFSEFLNERAIP